MSSAGKKSASGAASSVISYLKLTIPSGGATPTPPIGPALGQKGVKAIDFCRQFNETSSKLYLPPTPLRCSVRVNPDRTFAITVRPPASAWLLKKAAGIDKADSSREVAKLPVQYVYEIAKIKAKDPLLQHVPLKRIFEMIAASAKYKPKDPPILVPRLVFMSKKAIAYKVYPGDSARMFPGFQTVIFVNPDLYDQWVKDHASVKFEDVLIDPQNPVKYYGDGIINDIRSTYNVPNDKLQRWYQTCDPMQLARITAEEGRDITRQLE